VSSLSPRPESHDDEDGRDSIERLIARYGEQSNRAIAVISLLDQTVQPSELRSTAMLWTRGTRRLEEPDES
jgi:hypothetical protein